MLAVPLTTTLAAAMPHIDPALVDSPARAALGAIAGRLPAALTRRTYIECRLAEQASRVDLVFCVDRSSRVLLMDPQRGWLPEHLATHPLWRGLERLCAEWADPRSPIAAGIYDLWLEFDTNTDDSSPARDALVPSVFVGLTGGIATASLAYVELLTGRRLDPAIAATIRRVVDRMPDEVTVPYVGLMYSRPDRAIRLCLSPLAGSSLLRYLEAIDWPGNVTALAQELRSIPIGGGRTALECCSLLHVDIADGVQPRIGLEIPLPQHPQLLDARIAHELFDSLCDRGLCAAAKRDALMRWAGHAVAEFPHQCWPSLALRRISHVKVVHEPGRGTELKTYLSFFHRFRRKVHHV